MALIIYGQSRCAICGDMLVEGEAIVATSHFIADRQHRLWRFSDAPIHRACFLTWKHRTEFVVLFNQIVGNTIFGNGTFHHMESDGTITAHQARNSNELSD